MEDKIKNKRFVLFALLLIPIILIIGISYAYFISQTEVNEEEKVTIASGSLTLTFRDDNDTVENIEGSWTFGDKIEKELIIENTGTLDAYAKISWDNLINTYLRESLTYTLEEKGDEEGAVYKKCATLRENVPRSETAATIELADGLKIPAGHTYTYRLKITFEDLSEIDQTQDLNANFITKFTIEQGASLADKLESLGIKVQEHQDGIPNFSIPATTDETANGLFSMEDDYGTSYYYRGAVENNYVKFGTNAEGQEMWWRIIIFNGDGSIRMIYDGTQGWKNGVSSANRSAIKDTFYNKSNEYKFVGYLVRYKAPAKMK